MIVELIVIEIIKEDYFVEKSFISCDTAVASFSRSRQVTITSGESNNLGDS